MAGSRHIVTLVLAGDSTKLRKTFADSKTIIAAGFAAAGVAAVTMVGKSIGAFAEFQASLNQVEAVSSATGAQMERLKQQALDMGASTKFTAGEAAGAMGFLAQAGLSVDQTMGALPATLNLAAAGNLDLATAADLATNVMSGFGLGVEKLAHVTDAMAVSAASANVSVAQVGAAMTYVGPVASAAGLSLDEVTAAIGLLGNAGFQGEMGGTALRGAITKLINPSREGAAILEKLGIKALDSSGKMLPLEIIVEQLGQSGLTAGQAMEIFGQRAGPGMLALVSQGAPALRELTLSLQESDGAAAAMAETQQKGLVGAMTQLSSATGNLLIIIGDQFAPLVSEMAGHVTEAARGFATWVQESDGLKTALGGMQSLLSGSMSLLAKYKDTLILIGRGAVAAAAGFVAYKAANLAYAAGQGIATAAMWLWNAAFTVGTGGLNLIIPAIVAVGTAMFLWGDKIKAFLSGPWNSYVGAMDSIIRPFRAIAGLMGIDLPESLDRFKVKTEQVSKTTMPEFATSLGVAKRQLKQTEDGIADMLEAGMDPDPELLDWVTELRTRIDDLSRFTMPAFVLSLEGAETQLEQAERGMQQMRDAGMDVDVKMVEWTNNLRDHVEVLRTDYTAALRRAVTETEEAARLVASAELNEHYAVQAKYRAESTKTTTWLEKQYTDRLAAARQAQSDELNDFWDMQVAFRSEAAATSVWLADEAQTAGTASGTGFLTKFSDVLSADNLGQTFARAFEGASGWLGALKSLASQMAGVFTQALGGWLSKGLSSVMSSVLPLAIGGAMSAATPVLASAAIGVGTSTGATMATATGTSLFGGLGAVAAAIPVWGWAAAGVGAALMFFKGWGGPSKAEQEAREIFSGFHAGAVDALGGTQRYADEVQVAIDNGWERTLAETRAAFIVTATAAGVSYDDAFRHYERYQTAVGAGNTKLMERIEADYAEWQRVAGETADANTLASAESTTAIIAHAKDVGDQFKGLTTEEAAQLGDALIGLGSKANQSFTDIHDSAIAAGNALANRFLPHILSVSRAISNMPSIETPIAPSQIPGRAGGGAVLPGRPYIVGEGGREELFVPSQSGTILPRVPTGTRGVGPIDITLQIDGRTLNAELIRVHENTLDFYGQ